MPLTPGLRLGPYEIQSPLGAGGMGEVYRARDTRLDRIVAIKVLSSQLSSEPQFRERFDREARAISALEHAHICPLYDIGEHEGTSFLVMQYLEGETLDARLQRGPLPFDLALQCAMQIADALDKAHRAGIVHRDLKPGNVMLTKAGAKLLDFGLAKSTMAPGAVAGLSMLPTTPPGLTAQGTILGTFQYMAPEQLEGQDADPRTDIFAFGAVLYEMLTGKKAFEGRSQASLIGAILKDHPPDPSTVQPLAPRALDRIVRTCLAKDPDERWQSAGDLHRELRWIRESPRDVSTEPSPGAAAGRRRWRKVAVAGLVIASLASVSDLISRRFETTGPVAPTLVRFAVPTQTNLTDHYSSNGFAISPDGRTLAYVDGVGPKYTVFVRSIDSLESKALVTGDLLYAPFWSPDGRSVAVFADDSLKTVSVADGTIQTVCPLPRRRPRLIHGGTWAAENVLLFAVGGDLYRVAALGGTPVRLFEKDNSTIRWPQILPGGKRFLYERRGGLYVGALDGTATAAEKPIVQVDYMTQYADPGYLVFVRDGVLLAQRFDAENASLSGTPTPIAPRVAVSPDINFRTAEFSVAGSSLVYRSGSSLNALTWVDRSGAEHGVIGEPNDYAEADLSPDGRQVAVEINDNGFGEIWVIDAARGTRIPITRTPDVWEYGVRWSPDARYVAYSVAGTRAERQVTIRRRLADGSGAEDVLAEITPPTLTFIKHWAPNGRSIVFAKIPGGLFNAPAPAKGEVSPLPGSSDSEIDGRLSPDGRWLAYTTTESGRGEVYVRPVTGGPRTLVSTAGGASPVWNRKGTELYYQAADGTIMAVAVSTAGSFRGSDPKPLFKKALSLTQSQVRQPFSTIDGERFLVRVPDASAPPSITWVMNWSGIVAAPR